VADHEHEHEHVHDHDEHDHDHDHGDPGGDDLRAALAQQLLQMRPADLLAQTAVMLANQAAIRLGMASPEHADREQAREAIDALAGIVELLAPLAPPEELEALRRDLAQLRMAYVQTGGGGGGGGQTPPAEDPPDEGPERPPIWTPGGDV
jgi:hypothetical protein